VSGAAAVSLRPQLERIRDDSKLRPRLYNGNAERSRGRGDEPTFGLSGSAHDSNPPGPSARWRRGYPPAFGTVTVILIPGVPHLAKNAVCWQ
jgi:hypothetical protein